MWGRHSCFLDNMFVVEVGGLVCVLEGVDRHGANVIASWAGNSVPLYFVELHEQDVGDVVG